MVPALYHGTSARKDGLGNTFMESVGIATVASSFLLVALFHFSAFLFFHGSNVAKTFGIYISVAVALYLFSLLTVRSCKGRFGGLTGDNFGAISEISEIIFLMVTSLWLQHSI